MQAENQATMQQTSMNENSIDLNNIENGIKSQEVADAMQIMRSYILDAEKLSQSIQSNSKHINSKLSDYEKEINSIFNELNQSLLKRKKTIMHDLYRLITTKKEELLEQYNENNNLLKESQKKLQICSNLLSKDSSMIDSTFFNNDNNNYYSNDIKLEILKIKQEIESINAKNLQNNNIIDTQINININPYHLKQQILHFGTVTCNPRPILVSLKNNGKNFMIEINWKLSSDDIEKYNIQKFLNKPQKIRVEWCKMDENETNSNLNNGNFEKREDEKDENDSDPNNNQKNEIKFKFKDFLIPSYDYNNNDNDNNNNDNNLKIDVMENGIFLFRIKHYYQKSWSIYSELSKIIIAGVSYDKWDENLKGEKIEILGNVIMNKSHDSGYQSAYLDNIVENGRHEWKFQVFGPQSSNRIIGIHKWSEKLNENVLSEHCNNFIGKKTQIQNNNIINDDNDNDSQSLFGLNSYFTQNLELSYGKSFSHLQSGDIIDMCLDFNNLELSFKLNSNQYGKVIKIDKYKYKAVISLYSISDKIKIIQYHYNEN